MTRREKRRKSVSRAVLPASSSSVSAEATGTGRSLVVIYATVALDAAGIGLVFPILPRLIESVTHKANVSPYVGSIAALYAAMQFVFAPVLGALSDRLGRRPILLVSLAGAALNYLVMVVAPQLWMLMLGRAIAGLTSANVSCRDGVHHRHNAGRAAGAPFRSDECDVRPGFHCRPDCWGGFLATTRCAYRSSPRQGSMQGISCSPCLPCQSRVRPRAPASI